MELLYSIFIFAYGLLFGSFFNVVGYRIPNNLSIVKPGSFCPKCNHKLKWYELIPVFSFLIQGGKCCNCKCKISVFYPLMEFLTGVLFLISYLVFGFSSLFIISIIVSSFLVIVIVSDFNYLIISDEVTLFFSILSIVLQFILFGLDVALSAIVYGVFMFFLMYFIMLFGNKIMKEEAMGGGDVKLMFFIGSIISLVNPISFADFKTYCLLINSFFEVFLASCLAIPVAIINYFSKKERVVPFGPFILLSALIILLSSFNIMDFILNL